MTNDNTIAIQHYNYRLNSVSYPLQLQSQRKHPVVSIAEKQILVAHDELY